MVGKWHNTPNYLTLPSSPKDSWPSQRGFDYFYGFLGGETNFFFPARLMLGNALLPIDTIPGRLLHHRRLDRQGHWFRARGAYCCT